MIEAIERIGDWKKKVTVATAEKRRKRKIKSLPFLPKLIPLEIPSRDFLFRSMMDLIANATRLISSGENK